MKKVAVVLMAICFITMSMTTKSMFNGKESAKELNAEKYKMCIAACNNSITSCTTCDSKCTKDKDTKMAICSRLCKECISSCQIAVKSMNVESKSVKSDCADAATACNKCADECEKFTNDHCKKCANECRKAAKMCADVK